MRTATADPGFQVRGGRNKKKLRRAEGGAKNFGVFRVKNHDFTQKNHIFSNCGGRRENVWGISCEKSRFFAKKIIFFPIFRSAPGSPNLNTPVIIFKTNDKKILSYRIFIYNLGGIFILRTFKNTLYAGVLFVYTRSSR